MWNPFKKKIDYTSQFKISLEKTKCVLDDPDVTTVAGYLDDDKQYHDTKEATVQANDLIRKREERRRKEELVQKNKMELRSILDKHYPVATSDYYYTPNYRSLSDLLEGIVRHPKVLKDFLNTLEDA